MEDEYGVPDLNKAGPLSPGQTTKRSPSHAAHHTKSRDNGTLFVLVPPLSTAEDCARCVFEARFRSVPRDKFGKFGRVAARFPEELSVLGLRTRQLSRRREMTGEVEN
jgi:hypothetical protein